VLITSDDHGGGRLLHDLGHQLGHVRVRLPAGVLETRYGLTPGEGRAEVRGQGSSIVGVARNEHEIVESGASHDFVRQQGNQQMVAWRQGEHPRDVGQVHGLVGADRADQRQARFDDDLFGQMRRVTVDAADDGPDALLEHQPRQLLDAAAPRVVRPRRDQAKREAAIAAVAIRLGDRRHGGTPQVAVTCMLRIAGAEIADQHFGHVLRRRLVTPGTDVFGLSFAEDGEWLRSGRFGGASRRDPRCQGQ